MSFVRVLCWCIITVLSILAAACWPDRNPKQHAAAANGAALVLVDRSALLQGFWMLEGDDDSLVIHLKGNRRASRQQIEAGYDYDTWTLQGDTLITESLLWGRQIRTLIVYLDSNSFVEEGDCYTNYWKRISSSDSLTY